ncbi:hypothetical protein AB0A77_25740 [Streptomyces varsoviensis]|uniref:hypothetical protein n=1 Tax=Streptomyces varsoviensis TaxID=67373 RepID=UPI0033CB5DEE
MSEPEESEDPLPDAGTHCYMCRRALLEEDRALQGAVILGKGCEVPVCWCQKCMEVLLAYHRQQPTHRQRPHGHTS